jgi:tRNA uracil 4-sulfurtransferase
MKYVICHYSEIALKRRNRKFFEECLIKNIKRSLKSSFYYSVRRISGRIIINLTPQGEENKDDVKNSLEFVFGISSFSFALNSDQDISEIKKNVINLLEKEKFDTFRITAKRTEKNFPLSSSEINEIIGGDVLQNFKNVKVNLKNPDLNCFIEIVEKYAFIFSNKHKGINGLPVGSSGKAISLLSGGIDSPVSSFLSMKRGLKVLFIHFHSYPETSQASINKVKEVVNLLSRYQGKSKLYLVPISEIQKEISLNISEKLRIIFYRKIMIKISEKIAFKERSKTLIMGDSIGQVASQTVENIKAVESNIDCLIIRPLICMDKEEIIRKAEEIKTFNISILPYDDCCSRFLPKNPETKAKEFEVMQETDKIDIEKMIKKALERTETVIFGTD